MCVKDGIIPSAKYMEQYFSNIRALRSNDDALHAFGMNVCGVRYNEFDFFLENEEYRLQTL
jgi:hypothetical protein